MKKTTVLKSFLAAAAVVGLVLGAWSVSSSAVAAADDENDKLQVGIFEIERTFHEYHGTQQFLEQMQALEEEFMQAQQAQNQQRMMELQMQAQRLHEELDARFTRDVQQATEDVARDRRIKLIVSEIVYKHDDVEEVDLTEHVITAINRDVAETDDE